MAESFRSILTIGEHRNSLGRAGEILQIVLHDRSRLDELFECVMDDDAWVRMRAIDTLEKVCRVHPDWLLPYVERLLHEVAAIDQPSIQWHLAELFAEIELSESERKRAIHRMIRNITDIEVDWIVAANTMETLTMYVNLGYLPAEAVIPLLKKQQAHRSQAVVRRATKLLGELNV
jgi:hypothetical protein